MPFQLSHLTPEFIQERDGKRALDQESAPTKPEGWLESRVCERKDPEISLEM